MKGLSVNKMKHLADNYINGNRGDFLTEFEKLNRLQVAYFMYFAEYVSIKPDELIDYLVAVLGE